MRRFPQARAAAPGLALLLAAAAGAPPAAGGEPAPPDPGAMDPDSAYYLYLAAESEDEVALIRFAAGAADVVRTIPVGRFPTETDGAHGLTVDPAGERWYVTLAHGNPFGQMHAYATGSDEKVGEVELGLFPATNVVTGTGLIFAVNFNLHGDAEPTGVSVVDARAMTEIARIITCVMPHGSRLGPDGRHHYSTCTRDDQLVEIDTGKLEVSRRLQLAPGAERELSPDIVDARTGETDDSRRRTDGDLARESEGGSGGGSGRSAECSPTWAEVSPDGRFVYVTCNANAEVLEIDRERWEVARRFETGTAPYNLAVTPDGGLLVITYRGGATVGVWDLEAGEELATIPSTRRLPHGIAISPDSRYAFVSVEGIGGEPGTMDVIDLEELRRVTSVDTGKRAGGVAFWKQVPG